MTQPFPNDVFLTGWMAPSGMECEAPDLVVEGELPADLQGTYFRNGPDPLHPPREGDQYHWFHGDGMIQRFHIDNGRIDWKNRWVKTRKYELERAAGESLFGVLGNPMTADPSVHAEEYNTANTHIIHHHGKLLALMEGALAVEVDPDNLDTIQTIDFDGQIDGPITAHPKFDPNTGEMVFFGYQARGPGSREIRYNVADRNGKLTKNVMFEAPYASMVHDFCVTDTHVIFPIFPITFDIERAISGGLPLAWEPDKGTHFGVMPRDGEAEDIRWFEYDPRFMFHMMNAWNEGSTLHMDVTAANATQFAPKPDGSMADESDGVKPLFRRWSLDLDSGGIKETMLGDLPCEFPRTDEAVATQRYRHGFAVGGRGRDLMFNELVHYDLASGSSKSWSGGDHYLFGEPVVAPRRGAKDEADGYLLMLAFNQQTQLSELMIFDTMNVETGPVGKAMLPTRIPAGFHGSWVAA